MTRDEECYLRFLRGDQEGLEELMAIHKRGLTLFIAAMVGDLGTAEELMIDAFANLVVSKNKFQGRSSLKTYLFAIGRNEALRYLRKHRRECALSLETIMDDSFEETLLCDEEKKQLYAAMKKLNGQYRQVLFLLYFENMSYREAGYALKKSEKQITNIAYRGKKALKVILEKAGFTYEG